MSVDTIIMTGRRTRFGFRDRLHAAAWHLAISALVAALVLMLIYGFWYPSPLDSVSGVRQILLVLLAVDVSIGPLLTFIVFNRQKKSLRMDLALIALVQCLALALGLQTVEAGRPLYLVFTVDRFEVVSRSDLRVEDLSQAANNPAAQGRWFGPSLVAVVQPESMAERQTILTESVTGGRDLQHYPHLYRELGASREAMAAAGQSIAVLRKLNGDATALLDQALSSLDRDDATVRFVPVKGFSDDAAMLIDSATGDPLKMVGLKPW